MALEKDETIIFTLYFNETRKGTIANLLQAQTELQEDEHELKSVLFSTTSKLKKISDDEFQILADDIINLENLQNLF